MGYSWLNKLVAQQQKCISNRTPKISLTLNTSGDFKDVHSGYVLKSAFISLLFFLNPVYEIILQLFAAIPQIASAC